MRHRLMLAGALGVLAAAGCGAQHPSVTAPPASSSSSTASSSSSSSSVPATPGPSTLPPTTVVSPGTGGSSCAPAPVPGGLAVRGNPAGCTVTVTLGQTLQVELAPVAWPGGGTRAVGLPISLDPAILGADPVPPACPSGYSCASFATRAAGSATIRWAGPSGCVPQGPCVNPRLSELTAIVTQG